MTGCFNGEDTMLYRVIVRSLSLYRPPFFQTIALLTLLRMRNRKKEIALGSE